jgi:hypothetical protein
MKPPHRVCSDLATALLNCDNGNRFPGGCDWLQDAPPRTLDRQLKSESKRGSRSPGEP